MGIDVRGGKSVMMRKIWHLVQMLMGTSPAMCFKKNVIDYWGETPSEMGAWQICHAQDALGVGGGNLKESVLPFRFVSIEEKTSCQTLYDEFKFFEKSLTRVFDFSFLFFNYLILVLNF